MPQPDAVTLASVAPDTFRAVMGHFVTGITVVTTLQDGQPRGITVNALTSVSLEPPLVVVALDRRRFITPSVHETGRYAVNVLSEDQQALSDCFAGAAVTPDRDAFCGAAWTPGPTGLPLIDGAIATLECSVTQIFQAGDHELFVARVDSVGQCRAAPDAAALLPPPVPPDPARRDRAARGRARARDGGPATVRPRRRGLRAPAACRPSPRTASRSPTRRTAPGRRSSSSTARRRSAGRTSPPRSRCSRSAFQLILPDARGHGRTRWDARRRLPLRLAGRRPRRRSSTALGLETFHLAGLLDGGDDRAAVRDRAPGAAADARRRRHHARSASRARRSPGG